LFALYADDYYSGLILRGLTGIGMGGTYMPGLKLVAERFESTRRGGSRGLRRFTGTGGIALAGGARHYCRYLGLANTAMLTCSIGVFFGFAFHYWSFAATSHRHRSPGHAVSAVKSCRTARPCW
jgi:MFS family permease